MRIKDISVGAKVMGAFACVLVATVALGLFAVQRLSNLNDNAEAMSSRWVPAMKALSEFQYNSTRFRSFSSTYLLPCSDEERENTAKLLKKSEGKSDEALSRFVAMASSARDRPFAAKLQESWNAYKPMREEQVSLYKSGGLEAAAAYFMGPMRKTFKAVTEATDDAISYSADGAATAGLASRLTYASAKMWVSGAVGLALLLCCGAWYLIRRSVSVPLIRMTGAMGELAAGRLDADVPHADQADEIGKLAEAMTTFKDRLVAAERSKAEQTELIVGSIGAGLEHLAKGNVTHRIDAELVGPFAKLKSNFNAALDRLQDTLKSVMESASQITTGAGEISQASDDLSRRTEQQAASLEETAAALEEITATVKTTAANAKEARASVTTAKSAAEDGGRVVNTAIEAMDAISQSSKQITDIIGVIDEIAFQTNLLALNAGVEAARAGEAGRGFAVVASEVRSLAQRSSEAAKQIKTLINASGEQVGSGVRLVGETGAALRRIMDQVQQINGLVTEMAQAAEQQSTGIEEVNSAVSQMDQVTQQNAAMVEQSTAASRNLASETQILQELVGFFDVGLGTQIVRRPEPQQRKVVRTLPAARPASGRVRVASRGGAQPAQAVASGDWTEF